MGVVVHVGAHRPREAQARVHAGAGQAAAFPNPISVGITYPPDVVGNDHIRPRRQLVIFPMETKVGGVA